MPEPRRIRWAGRIGLALLAALLGSAFVGQSASAAEPPVPEDVAAYFATGLVPRLADLYGSASNTDPASVFDETTKVGTIHRLLAWAPDFLAGKKTDAPTQLTNTWIAPVTAKSGTILGLAAVWINPGSDVVELADFSRGSALVDALGRAPKDTLLIDDAAQQAWFATDGTTLTPLVVGTSKTTAPLTPAQYQTILRTKAVPAAPTQTVTNPGLLIAGITLGVVVLLLAVFILLPGRKRRNDDVDVDVDVDADSDSDSDAPVAESASAEPAPTPPVPARSKRSFEPGIEPGTSSPKPRKATTVKAVPLKGMVAESVEAKRTPAKATPVKKAPAKTAAAKATGGKAAPRKTKLSTPRPPTS